MDENEVKKRRVDMNLEGNKFVNWLKRNVAMFVAIGISILFLFSGAIKITPNDMDVKSKVIYALTIGLFGLTLSTLVSEGGYTSGKQNPLFICTREKSVDACQKALPYRREAELYVSNKIKNDIKQERIEILGKACINYDEIFSVNDIPLKIERIRKKYSRKQRHAIKQAIRIKEVPFALFGFTSVKSVGRKEAPSENKRRRNKFASSFTLKLVIALLSGSVAFTFLGISVENLLYSLFQLGIWFGSGMVARISNYNFIVNNVREYDQERIWYLEEFMALPQTEKEKLTSLVKHETMLVYTPTKNNNIEEKGEKETCQTTNVSQS